jgi:DNA ligase (NAD+)
LSASGKSTAAARPAGAGGRDGTQAQPAPTKRATARAARLRSELEHHAYRYYVLDDPEIGDDAYDAMLDELRELEARYPQLVTPDSPTQRVGSEPVGRLEKVRHPEPMLSLGNVRSEH